MHEIFITVAFLILLDMCIVGARIHQLLATVNGKQVESLGQDVFQMSSNLLTNNVSVRWIESDRSFDTMHSEKHFRCQIHFSDTL